MSTDTQSRIALPQATVDERLGHRLKLRRTLLNLTQEQVARECGITYQQVHKYETGQSKMNTARLIQFSLVLETPVAWFFDGLEPCDGAVEPSESDAQFERTAIRLVSIAQQIKSKQKLRQLIDFAKILAEEDQA
ncbi:MAG: helix-turn-helix transcriptional regulator [Pseudomonadota bacterium]